MRSPEVLLTLTALCLVSAGLTGCSNNSTMSAEEIKRAQGPPQKPPPESQKIIAEQMKGSQRRTQTQTPPR